MEHRKFYFYSQLQNRDNLHAAWRVIRDKGSAGGTDGVTIQAFEEKFEENMQALLDELRECRFIPQPYQEVRIPKGDGEFRSLGLMTFPRKLKL